MMDDDTIVALATAPGYSSIGVVRLSGKKAYFIALNLTKTNRIEPQIINYKSMYSVDDEPLDQGLVLYFNAPKSFTGEDVIELQMHGSPLNLAAIIEQCLRLGARLAKPGEFSQRAFLNNKMDLIQAEAIADLIHAQSTTAARLAVRSLQGDFSKRINELSHKIIKLRVFVEAAIDFPDEEIDFLNEGGVLSSMNDMITLLFQIKANASQGALLREGAVVVIAGHPNAGKSTLMNALAGFDLSIVTPIPGTTRDVMKTHVVLDGLPVQLIDTAGLRQTDDVVEQEGISRAWDALGQADCVLMLADINEPKTEELSAEIKQKIAASVAYIQVLNKIDTLDGVKWRDEIPLRISAKTGEGLAELKDCIKKTLGYHESEGLFLARARHVDALNQALLALERGREQLMIHHAAELLAADLGYAHQALSQITGEFTPEDLLGKIFSSFCIGK